MSRCDVLERINAECGARGRLPDFFIAGAAKSGTTSLWRYLLQHPDIFMPRDIRFKEPSFFCDTYGMKDIGLYTALFSDAGKRKMVGEASTPYLTSPESPVLIRKMSPDAKIIILLRNPAARAYSLYNWMIKEGYEYALSFEAALALEESRCADRKFKFSNPQYYYNYLYFRSGLYSAQIKRYLDTFPREQVLVLLFEDLKADSVRTLRRVFDFLGVDDAFTPDFGVHNEGRVPKSIRLQYFLRQRLMRYLLSLRVPYDHTAEAVSRLIELNTVEGRPPAMREATRRLLTGKYADDIRETGRLIGADLSHWLKADNESS